MSKTVKIAVGIFVSAFLFYFFIRDVNSVPLLKDAGGAEHSIKQDTLELKDITGLRPGDQIRICDNRHTEGEMRTIQSITPIPGVHAYKISLDAPLTEKYAVAEKAVIKFPRLQRTFRTANYYWLFPALLLTIAALLVRAYRWKFFFPEYDTIKFNSLWASVCIGYMSNNILPFRIGEIIRAWIIGRKENRKISEAFATIVVERVFDILSIIILFVGFIFYFASQDDISLPQWMVQGAWIITAVSVIALGFLLFLRFRTESTLAFVRFFLKPFPEKIRSSVMHLVGSFVTGLSILSHVGDTLIAFFLSMVVWLVLAVAYYFEFLAVGIHTSLLVSVFLIVGLAFAVSIPSAPGFIGTFHFVGKEVLLMLGVVGNIEAYVLLAHAMAYIPVVVLGLIYLSLENISFRDLRNSMKLKSEIEA